MLSTIFFFETYDLLYIESKTCKTYTINFSECGGSWVSINHNKNLIKEKNLCNINS